MAKSFIEKKNRLKYLLSILAAFVFCAILVFAYLEFSPKIEKEIFPDIEIPVKKIEIDFAVLEHSFFEKLQPFPEIEPFTEEIDRENPFISY